jgi:hypothetical protein
MKDSLLTYRPRCNLSANIVAATDFRCHASLLFRPTEETVAERRLSLLQTCGLRRKMENNNVILCSAHEWEPRIIEIKVRQGDDRAGRGADLETSRNSGAGIARHHIARLRRAPQNPLRLGRVHVPPTSHLPLSAGCASDLFLRCTLQVPSHSLSLVGKCCRTKRRETDKQLAHTEIKQLGSHTAPLPSDILQSRWSSSPSFTFASHVGC